MAEPIVFISNFRIVNGKRAQAGSMLAYAADLIGSTKPQTALFAAYVDETGTEARIVHAFHDAAAMASHFAGSSERAMSVAELMSATGFQVYGPAPDAAIEQLAREAAEEKVALELFPVALGGFIRPPF